MDTQNANSAGGPRSNIVVLVVILVLLALSGYFFINMQPVSNENAESSDTTDSNPSMKVPAEDSTVPETEVMEESAVKSFVIEGNNFKFEPNALKVNLGDTVRISFKNVSGFHDLKIDEFNAATKVIQTGQEETIEFIASKAGSFEFYCSVGNHRAQGMKGILMVE